MTRTPRLRTFQFRFPGTLDTYWTAIVTDPDEPRRWTLVSGYRTREAALVRASELYQQRFPS